MTFEERKAQVKYYLGKTVNIKIDRPIGYVHKKEKYSLTYPINYGYIPGVLGGDGEELDVYLLGVDIPVEEYTAKIIGIVHRENDVEDKLVAAPLGMAFNQAEIAEAIHFQEQYYKTYVEAIKQKSCGAVVYRKRDKDIEYLCLLQKRSRIYSVPKGHIDAFETEEQTAKREIFEEVGIIADFQPDFREEIQYNIPDNKRKKLVLFIAEYNGELNINGNEIADYCWLTAEEAKHVLPKWYKDVIVKADEFINMK